MSASAQFMPTVPTVPTVPPAAPEKRPEKRSEKRSEKRPENRLEDRFGRRFRYLRLSVTDVCNFRCVYCLPNGYQKPAQAESELSVPEIRRLLGAFADLGTVKVRLTGGEPTVRRDLIEIIETVRAHATIETVALSTNALYLAKNAEAYAKAGVSALNISIDSLDRDRFRARTGLDAVARVVGGIDRALELGFAAVKINAVLFSEKIDDDFELFLDFIRERPVAVRWIELMPTAQNRELFRTQHLPGQALRERLLTRGWRARDRGLTDGPAQEFTHENYRGRVGLITPYAQDFCASCNRLRVTAKGELRMCLFGEGSTSVRHLLAADSQREELKLALCQLLLGKQASHHLLEGKFGDVTTFSSMGG